GEYLFQTRLFRTNLGMMRGLEYPHRIEYTIDGVRVHAADIGGRADLAAAFEKPTETGDAVEARLRVRVPVKAGLHRIGVAFAEDLLPVGTVRLQPFLRSSYDTLDWTGRPHIEMVSITGPFNPTGVGDTPSRRRIFVCRPPAQVAQEAACAKRIVRALMRRAYRREPTRADLDHALRFYREARRECAFDCAIQAALQFMLTSPNFVFRVERDPAGATPGTAYRLSETELASRLSFFLWSSIPDDQLLELAAKGQLTQPVVWESEVRRMLADPRSEALT